jgi:hypothetical protein
MGRVGTDVWIFLATHSSAELGLFTYSEHSIWRSILEESELNWLSSSEEWSIT